MVSEVTRHIKKDVERELWARSAGRCEFSGCNKLLFKSSVTEETVNIAQKAHIYSFSKSGPRGWGPFYSKRKGLNEIGNLMLMCHGCHTKIDQDRKGTRYSAELLFEWKREHEQKVEIVTGIRPDKKSNVVLYSANIGREKSPIDYVACIEAMFPKWYPSSERPTRLSMVSELSDSSSSFWDAESQNLVNSFQKKISPLIDYDSDCNHFSVFAFAPQPLLIKLGSLFTDKVSVETYQLHKEPKGWKWAEEGEGITFSIDEPEDKNGRPVLLLALSDYVSINCVTSVMGEDASIWVVRIDEPNNDFIQAKSQLSGFRKMVRKLMVDIKAAHGCDEALHIFPVMPISCSVELGRCRMPKADMPWVIYDREYKSKKFIFSLKLV